MDDPMRQTVQLIDEYAWEGGTVDPIGRAVTVEDWLAKLRELDMTLGVMPASRIAGGAYDGGHVLVAAGSGRLYFAVPAAAIPLLEGVLPADDYADLLRRTPAPGPLCSEGRPPGA